MKVRLLMAVAALAAVLCGAAAPVLLGQAIAQLPTIPARGALTGNVSIDGQYHNLTFFDNGNSSTADTIDWSESNVQLSTLTGDVTFTFSNPQETGRYVLKLVQDGMGGRTVTWPGTVLWPGGAAPTITVTAAAVDICTFLWDGTNYFGACAQDFQ